MSTPKRIQMTRQRPWRAEHPDAVIVARPGRWGNPYRVTLVNRESWEVYRGEEFISAWPTKDMAVTDAVKRFAIMLDHHRAPWGPDDIRAELAGRDLACWCPLDQPCHADVLLELANPKGAPDGR